MCAFCFNWNLIRCNLLQASWIIKLQPKVFTAIGCFSTNLIFFHSNFPRTLTPARGIMVISTKHYTLEKSALDLKALAVKNTAFLYDLTLKAPISSESFVQVSKRKKILRYAFCISCINLNHNRIWVTSNRKSLYFKKHRFRKTNFLTSIKTRYYSRLPKKSTKMPI